jgi:hypothetical protein
MFGEFLVRRPLTHPVWHGRFISWAVWGLVLYAMLFTVFLLENSSAGDGLIKEKLNKKTYIFAMLFVLLGVFVIMFQANWTFGDDHQCITTTAVNKYVPFAPFTGSGGRFFPLWGFHYNILLFAFRILGIDRGGGGAAGRSPFRAYSADLHDNGYMPVFSFQQNRTV